MATYRELLAQVRGEIDEISIHRGARAPRCVRRNAVRRRPRVGRVGRGARPRCDLHRARSPGAAHRGPRARQDAPARRLLLGGIPLGVRREGARGPRLRARREPRRRLRGLEAQRVRGHDPARPLPRAARALQPPPAHPRGRRGGTAAPPRRARPPDRCRRPRIAGLALPRRRRRRHARHRRRGRRRRVEPPAADRPLDRPPRGAQGRAPRSGRSRRSTRT